MNRHESTARYLPSPRQVASMCQQIQATWTPKERARRAVRKSGRWVPPQVRVSDLGLGSDRRPSLD
ncbi:MAG: hypothetical protein K2Y37_25760 [Pirellulales bacterium]|nr:hypothetical protein [Pirellulales bacterium]